MANPAKGEASFEHAGKQHRLYFGMTAIDWFEDTFDKSWLGAIQSIASAQDRRELPKMGLLVSVLQAGLRKHHPDLATEEARDAVLAMAVDPDVQAQMGVAVTIALPAAEGAEGNAPKPKKAKPKGSTSKAGSASLSKAA